jgi:uncharacterized protein (DUF1697 family)
MRYVALLRAVNVGGRKVSMEALRSLADRLGYENVRTLVASGNLVFDTQACAATRLEATLEAAIEQHFGLVSEVMVRTPKEWSAIIKANPYPGKVKKDPAHLVCIVCKDKPDAPAINLWLESFRAKYDKGEQLKVVGREIYVDYGDSIGQSKLVLPKKLLTGTARNWNTVLKLEAMLND